MNIINVNESKEMDKENNNYNENNNEKLNIRSQMQNIIHVFDIIDKITSEMLTQQSIIIPDKLTKKQRNKVHTYVQLCGYYTSTIDTNDHTKKRIEILLHPIITKKIDDSTIDFFIKYSHIPFPCLEPKYLNYYIKLFDKFYESEYQWNIFDKEQNLFDIKKEASHVTSLIIDHITMNPIFKIFMNNVQSQKKYHKQITEKNKHNIYNVHNKEKKMMSVDIKSANFTMLCNSCPELFTTDDKKLLTWYEFVKQFTKSEFLSQSKYFRELTFGKMNNINTLSCLQEVFMDLIHNNIIKHYPSFQILMKNGDEIVYDITNSHDAFTNEFEDLCCIINKVDMTIMNFKTNIPTSSNLHINIFTIDQILDTDYYIKTYLYNNKWINAIEMPKGIKCIELKNIPKQFVAQIIKWYNKEEIIQADLAFIHEGFLAHFQYPCF